MRLFVAIPVEPPVDGVLGELLRRWSPRGWPVKWVRPDGLHLTLKFLGAVESHRFEPIVGSLAGAIAGTPHLSFTLIELGGFPSLGEARVLWAGLESEAALELLVHRVERSCEALGFPVEGRPYRPHVTLGRIRAGSRLSPEATGEVESAGLNSVSFMSTRVILYESLTGSGGSRYQPRATFPLGN